MIILNSEGERMDMGWDFVGSWGENAKGKEIGFSCDCHLLFWPDCQLHRVEYWRLTGNRR
jgi:hypothetical protein